MGDGIRLTALPLLVAAITRDPIVVSGVTVATFAPWILFSLPGGAIVDRVKPEEVDIPRFTQKAFLVQASGSAHQGAVFYLHWFDEAPNANRTQFVDEAKELAALGSHPSSPSSLFPGLRHLSRPRLTSGDSRPRGWLYAPQPSTCKHLGRLIPTRIAIVGHDLTEHLGI